MLQQAGVDIKNLSLYSGTTPMQDFKFGVFDAWQVYITNEPYQMQLQGIKTKQICPKKYGLDVYADILFTHENTVKTKPHLVEKFRAASLKGWRYAMMHMNESIRIIQQKYATDKTLDQLAYEAEKIKPFIVQSGEPIGHMSQTRWQWIAQLYNFTAKEFGQHKTAFIYKEKQKKQHTNWSWMLIVAVVFSLLCIPLYLKLIFFQKKKIELE